MLVQNGEYLERVPLDSDLLTDEDLSKMFGMIARYVGSGEGYICTHQPGSCWAVRLGVADANFTVVPVLQVNAAGVHCLGVTVGFRKMDNTPVQRKIEFKDGRLSLAAVKQAAKDLQPMVIAEVAKIKKAKYEAGIEQLRVRHIDGRLLRENIWRCQLYGSDLRISDFLSLPHNVQDRLLDMLKTVLR